ncbi:thiamine biosynthesis protein ThiS [Candidatus Endobugula sertula]|uniref:Thiamine biosynthesis protein ThiS n=1 Tax=Candidatus Endobugula sertula TaxID=62101 RepID=A0A1D2QNU5_9GAMM|nr:thiamine biosynthesis protein ThiS [Candidatus Endobugula sertula]
MNGEAVVLTRSINLSTLLEQQAYQMKKIAVAINGEFVPRSRYNDTMINDGDQVDVIQAVGGG